MKEHKKHAKVSGKLSGVMNPQNVTCVNIIQDEKAENSQKIFVESADKQLDMRKKRKKYIILNKKRYSDGSFEKKRSVIYKDYGQNYAKFEGKRTHSAVDYYAGSATALAKVLERGNHQISFNSDGSIELSEKQIQAARRVR